MILLTRGIAALATDALENTPLTDAGRAERDRARDVLDGLLDGLDEAIVTYGVYAKTLPGDPCFDHDHSIAEAWNKTATFLKRELRSGWGR